MAHLIGGTGLGLIALAWLVPNHYPPWTTAWNDGFAILGALTLSCSLWWRCVGTPTALSPFLPLAVTACLVTLTLQYLSGTMLYAGDGYVTALYLATLLLTFWAGAAIRQSSSEELPPHWIALSLLLGSLASVGVALCQWSGLVSLGIFGLELPAPGSRAVGNLAQPNQFATICFIGLSSALWLHGLRRIRNVGLWLCAAMLVTGMLMAQSRVSWLQMVVWTILGFWLAQRTGDGRLRRSVLGIGGLFLCLNLAWPAMLQILGLQAARSSESSLVSGAMRLKIWELLAEATAHTPWLGYGWLQTGWAQQQFALGHPPVGDFFEHAHNIALDILVWNGVLAGSLIITLCIWWGVRVIARNRNPENVAPLLVLAGVTAHGMVELPLEYAYILVPFGLCAGWVDAATHRDGSAFTVTKVMVASGLTTCTGLFGLIAYDYAIAESSFRTLRMEAAHIGTSVVRMEPPHLLVLNQLESYMRFIAAESVRGMSAPQVEASTRVSQRYGYAAAQLRHALTLGLNQRPAEAQLTLQRLCRIHPSPRCQEATEAWSVLQTQYPELLAVPFTPHSP